MSLKNAHFVKGNKEKYLNGLAQSNQSDWVYEQMYCVYHTFRELSPDAFEFLNSLDEELLIRPRPDVSIFAAHYMEWFKPLPKHASGSSQFH